MSYDDRDSFDALRSRRAFGVRFQMPPRSPHEVASDNLIEKALSAWDADRARAVGYVESTAYTEAVGRRHLSRSSSTRKKALPLF